MLVGIAGVVTGRRRDAVEPARAGGPPARGGQIDALGWLVLLCAATLLVVRALPGTPGHDGERQLLGAFPFLACLAGRGAETLRGALVRRIGSAAGQVSAILCAALALLWAGRSVWHYHPVQLSYYSELVGGLRGAARLGLEPTYYWDALDDDTLEWLNGHTSSNEKVLFCSVPYSLHYLRQWGRLRVGFLPEPYHAGTWRWYVLQNRPGMFTGRPWDRWLSEHGQPARPPRALDGVPLIWIFPIEEYERAYRAAGPGNIAPPAGAAG
jgi:hypothetical protein